MNDETHDLLRETIKSKLLIAFLMLMFVGVIFIALSQIRSFSDIASTLLLQLGGILIASALVSLVYEYYVRRHFLTLFKTETRRVADELLPIIRELRKLGVIGVYENRSKIDWVNLISSSKVSLQILGTSLGYWANIPNMSGAIENAIRNCCHIRFLSLDPNSEYASERGREIEVYDEPEKHFQEDIQGAMGFFKKRGCDVRTYDTRPGFVTVIVDSRTFICFLTYKVRGRDSVHFELEHSSKWATWVEKEFDMLWEPKKKDNGS